MADIERAVAENILERLSQFKAAAASMREQVQYLAPVIKEADDGQETERILREFAEASRQLISLTDTLTQQIRRAQTRAGHLSALNDQLERLRMLNLHYRDRFSDLWKSALPIQVNARLQELGTSEGEAWKKRWGKAGEEAKKALKSFDGKKSRLSLTLEQEEALLVLRYSGQSFSEVSRVLSVSPPHVLNRQNELEMDIAVQLLQDFVHADLVEPLGAFDDEDAGDRRRTSSLDVWFARPMRSVRPLRLQLGPDHYRVLFRLVDQEDETKSGETLIPGLEQDESRATKQFDRMLSEYLQRARANVFAVYWMQEAHFSFLPGSSVGQPTLEEVRAQGKPDIRSVLSSPVKQGVLLS